MAHFTPGAIISEIRGSVGQTTFSKNRYGPYAKQKLIQTNPDTPDQQNRRAAVSEGVAEWQALSDQEAELWAEYAKQTPHFNTLGTKYLRSGYNEFISRYVNRSVLGSALDGFAPFPGVRARPLQVFTDLQSESMEIFWSLSNNLSNLSVVIYASPPLSPGVRYINPSWLKVLAVVDVPDQEGSYDLYDAYVAEFSPTVGDNGKRVAFAIKVINSDNFADSKKFIVKDLAVDVFTNDFSSEYNAILTYAISQGWVLPSYGVQVAQNDLIISLVSSGYLSICDNFYCLANDAGTDFSRINWADPGTYDLVKNGTPDFIANEGIITSIGNTLLCPYNPSTDAVNFALDSAHVFDYLNTESEEFGSDFGGTQLFVAALLGNPRHSSYPGFASFNLVSTAGQEVANVTSLGFFVYENLSSILGAFTENDSTPVTFSRVEDEMPDQMMGIGCARIGTTLTNFTGRRKMFYAMGASLGGDPSELKGYIDAYLTAIS